MVDRAGDLPLIEAGFTDVSLAAPGCFVTAEREGTGGPVIVGTSAAAFRILTSSLREQYL